MGDQDVEAALCPTGPLVTQREDKVCSRDSGDCLLGRDQLNGLGKAFGQREFLVTSVLFVRPNITDFIEAPASLRKKMRTKAQHSKGGCKGTRDQSRSNNHWACDVCSTWQLEVLSVKGYKQYQCVHRDEPKDHRQYQWDQGSP